MPETGQTNISNPSALVWLRRDLRLEDNHALFRALRDARRVYCVFVFDRDILDALDDRADRRVWFIRESLVQLHAALVEQGSALIVLHGHAGDTLPALAAKLHAASVYANHDYEPAALTRDAAVSAALGKRGIAFITCKDQVIFEKNEVLTQERQPFSVFTAYKNAWLRQLTQNDLAPHPSEQRLDRLARFNARDAEELPSLESMGFRQPDAPLSALKPGMSGAAALFDDFLERIEHYRETRDFPSVKGPSYLSVHLRFGTISIRVLARAAWERTQLGGRGAQTWLNELIWRDFYFMILHHHPQVVTQAFRPAFDSVRFDNDTARFNAWCDGRTGYPLVDAAMRQLNTTGYMHNRLRMVSASFLVKDLHIDWRWGERYFARLLNDFDLAANNGGWQWAASTGCDAQPYFRIFNPVTQSERFDAEGKFIRKYLPQLAACENKFIHAPWLMNAAEQKRTGILIGRDYPAPIVDHAAARLVTLARYAAAKQHHPTERRYAA